MELWLRNMAELYKVEQIISGTYCANRYIFQQAKHFGEMILGKSTVCYKDGLVAFQFDSSFKESLGT
jgi:hypothetical protein